MPLGLCQRIRKSVIKNYGIRVIKSKWLSVLQIYVILINLGWVFYETLRKSHDMTIFNILYIVLRNYHKSHSVRYINVLYHNIQSDHIII